MGTVCLYLIGLYHSTGLCFYFDRETPSFQMVQFDIFNIKIQPSSKFLLIFTRVFSTLSNQDTLLHAQADRWKIGFNISISTIAETVNYTMMFCRNISL